jgi:hypothetical protein
MHWQGEQSLFEDVHLHCLERASLPLKQALGISTFLQQAIKFIEGVDGPEWRSKEKQIPNTQYRIGEGMPVTEI